jgi:hypothetical protein
VLLNHGKQVARLDELGVRLRDALLFHLLVLLWSRELVEARDVCNCARRKVDGERDVPCTHAEPAHG